MFTDFYVREVRVGLYRGVVVQADPHIRG